MVEKKLALRIVAFVAGVVLILQFSNTSMASVGFFIALAVGLFPSDRLPKYQIAYAVILGVSWGIINTIAIHPLIIAPLVIGALLVSDHYLKPKVREV